MKKACEFTLLKAWAMKEGPKEENPLEPLIEEIVRAGREPLTCQKVIMGDIPDGLFTYHEPKVCSECGEAYRYGLGNRCQRCVEPFLEPA
jgi:hypothetical protein